LLSIDAFPKAVPVFLQSPQIGFQQPKYSLGIPCADAGGLNTNYEALLSVHHATYRVSVASSGEQIAIEVQPVEPVAIIRDHQRAHRAEAERQ
jgi:hypothetical protein